MGVAFRGGATTNTLSTTVPIYSSLPGDLIVVCASSSNTTSWSGTGANAYLPAYTISGAGATWVGLTAVDRSGVNGFAAWIGYGVTTTGTTSVTLSGTTGTAGGICSATFSGCATVNPIYHKGAPQGQGALLNSTTTQTTDSNQTWLAGQLLVGVTGCYGFSGVPSGGGWGTTGYTYTPPIADTNASYVTNQRQCAINYQIATYPQSAGGGYWYSPIGSSTNTISCSLALVINAAQTTTGNFLELM